MKYICTMFIVVLNLVLLGFSVFTKDPTVKDNHFRFENFKREISSTLEYVYLLCSHKKVTHWTQAKQYQSGAHDLWVKASTVKSGIPSTRKETYVNFKVTLDAGKSYMLNREINNDDIALWIQEIETGIKVSPIISSKLDYPRFKNENDAKYRCKAGTI